MASGGKHVDKPDVTTDLDGPNSSPQPGHRPARDDRFVVHIPVNPALVPSASADRKVDDLFRQVFRGKVPDKPIDLVDKLSQVIRTRKVEGRAVPEFEFSVRPSSGTTGAISGQSVAQTSLSERAQAALADAEKRLDALKPMQTPTDPENLDALRAVTLTTYKRLVGELSSGGGLRATRVDRHFFVLIGTQPQTGAFELGAGSLLKKIQDSFNLKTGVNTTEDSANLANFRIVTENLFDIFRSWTGFKAEVDKDFSELSGKLSRKLAMIENEVTDVETALDEVGLDATDRESEVIESAETPPQQLTLSGLLLWIREFAAEEGPELIEGGGGIGIAATIPTLDQLYNTVRKLVTTPPVKDNNVQASLGSLERHLLEAKDLAEKITRPS